MRRIAYGLPQAGACRTTIPHRVRLYVSSAAPLPDGGQPRPPATPGTVPGAGALRAEFSVTPTAAFPNIVLSDGGIRGKVSEVTLAAPIVLSAGDALYVSVEMVGRYESLPDGGSPFDDGGTALNTSVCIDACRIAFDGGTAPRVGVDFWSNAAVEPYTWADMVADFGFPALFTIRAFGSP